MAQDVTQLLQAVQGGDAQAAQRLLPLVYEELRRLASAKMRRESPEHTLQPTALVHEAYLRLVHYGGGEKWDGRGHFFAAAAEAMRRILIESARRKQSVKHGGGRVRQTLGEEQLAFQTREPEQLLALDTALSKLATFDPQLAKLVELRYFTGLSVEEAAGLLGVSPRTAKRQWSYARAWLRREIEGDAA